LNRSGNNPQQAASVKTRIVLNFEKDINMLRMNKLMVPAMSLRHGIRIGLLGLSMVVMLSASKVAAQTSLKVNGQVEATAVQINNWRLEAPDYVFASTYKLDSLDIVRAYIEKNHHLPGIPSAKEIKEDGINLAEMNFKMLQKIEELTLHIIAQDTRIKKLEASAQ
jgi:hypothetical protein